MGRRWRYDVHDAGPDRGDHGFGRREDLSVGERRRGRARLALVPVRNRYDAGTRDPAAGVLVEAAEIAAACDRDRESHGPFLPDQPASFGAIFGAEAAC